MKIWFIAAWLFFSLHGNSTDLFEDAVQLIKKYEGWHHARDQPYVGYGHRLLPREPKIKKQLLQFHLEVLPE